MSAVQYDHADAAEFAQIADRATGERAPDLATDTARLVVLTGKDSAMPAAPVPVATKRRYFKSRRRG